MRKIKLIHYFIPSLLLVVALIAINFFRNLFLLDYKILNFDAVLFLTVFYLLLLLGTVIGPCIFIKKTFKNPIFSKKKINSSAIFLISFSVLSIVLLVYKYLVLSGGRISLSTITEIRLTRERNPNHEAGDMASGMIGMAFSGFPVVTYFYKEYFLLHLSKIKIITINLLLIIGILVSLLTGGRFTAAISMIFVYFLSRLKPFISNYQQSHRDKLGIISKIFIIFFFFFIVYIFSAIFLERAMGKGGSYVVLLNALSHNLEGASLPSHHYSFLLDNERLIPYYYIMSLFQHYIAHSFYQFDVLFSSAYPQDAPYLLAYQLYLHAGLLNKFGFNFISAHEILSQIPNPGTFFSLAGAFYLDFGYWGSLIAAFLSTIFGSYFWVNTLREKTLISTYISTLYLIYLLFSPIVSIISAGVFPSLLSLVFFLFLFSPCRSKLNFLRYSVPKFSDSRINCALMIRKNKR